MNTQVQTLQREPQKMQTQSTARLIDQLKLNSATNFVPKGSSLKGELQATEDIGVRIEGQYSGNIDMTEGGIVHISAGAVVEVESLVADFIFIQGSVKGNLHARKGLELAAGAKVKGQVTYDGNLDIHPGARVTGQIQGPETD